MTERIGLESLRASEDATAAPQDEDIFEIVPGRCPPFLFDRSSLDEEGSAKDVPSVRRVSEA
jgi:hypothetical protein